MEFGLPVRIRWDVDLGTRIGRRIRIARAIREAAPLVVEFRVDGAKGLKALPAILDELYRSEICAEATIRLSPSAVRAGRWRYPVGVIWAVDGERRFSSLLPEGAPSVSFTPDGETLPLLPDVLEEFAASDARTLHLPNVNAVRDLALRGHVSVFRPGQLDALDAALCADPVPLPGKRLVVHDHFLWKVLERRYGAQIPGRADYAGCQAGTALAYVDWDGNVYPCDALPVRLGNLAETPFEAIWRSPARTGLLASIRSRPPACASCALFEGCFAGCRGTAFIDAGGMDGRDPGCRQPRGPSAPESSSPSS